VGASACRRDSCLEGGVSSRQQPLGKGIGVGSVAVGDGACVCH